MQVDPRYRSVIRTATHDIVIYGRSADHGHILPVLDIVNKYRSLLGTAFALIDIRESLCTLTAPSRGPALPAKGPLSALKPGERIWDDDRNYNERTHEGPHEWWGPRRERDARA